jgi:hypothetical protein
VYIYLKKLHLINYLLCCSFSLYILLSASSIRPLISFPYSKHPFWHSTISWLTCIGYWNFLTCFILLNSSKILCHATSASLSLQSGKTTMNSSPPMWQKVSDSRISSSVFLHIFIQIKPTFLNILIKYLYFLYYNNKW